MIGIVRLKPTIHGQLFALRLMPVILLAIGFASAVQLWVHTVEATTKSEHYNTLFTCAQRLLGKMLDAETGARGYVATGRSLFLEPYNEAVPGIAVAAQRLAAHVAGEPTQREHAHQIDVLSAQETAILARYVALERGGRADLALAEMRDASGKRTMDRLRHEIGALESIAQGDATRTLAEMKAASGRTLYTLVGCIVCGSLFAAAAGWRIRRAIRRRVDALVRKAQNLAVGKDIGPRLGGTDEISDLDRAFHDMAELLAQRTRDLERYRLLADRTECLMLFARQRDGRIFHANAAALAAYRYTLAEICELTIDGLRSGDIPVAVSDGLTNESCVSLAYEAEQQRSDGTTFPGEVTVEGQLIAGEHVQLSIVRDISERKRTQRVVADALGAAQDAARAKTDFLATMSHEIRTPMNAVIGMTELVLQSALRDDQREALQIANDSGTALLRIIDDVLDFSKIEAGKLNVEIIEFSFATAVESVALTLAAQARTRGLSLRVFIDPRAPATMHGDEGRIRQILTNLVGNAIKFTTAGSITLSADVLGATAQWCEVSFSVTDTGIGIATDYLARIFQPFSQADASTTRVYGGSGLGLSICRQLVELMGGTLVAESVPGCGSRFSFVLRMPAGAPKAVVEPRRARALVVGHALDAFAQPASELTRYLRAWGIEPQIVASAADALTAPPPNADSPSEFDLMIVDADALGATLCPTGAALPERPGPGTVRRILVGSCDHPHYRSAAVTAGFDAYLMPPLRQAQTFDCIMNIAPVPVLSFVTPQAERSGRRVLLAEDNVINQAVASRQLHKLGYEVTVVDTGRAAVAAVVAQQYDVVLMDCFMPEMDGYAATGAIRRHQSPSGEHTPIIAMTANSQSGDRDRCLAAGMDDYLSKPVTLASLRDALERHCNPSASFACAAER